MDSQSDYALGTNQTAQLAEGLLTLIGTVPAADLWSCEIRQVLNDSDFPMRHLC